MEQPNLSNNQLGEGESAKSSKRRGGMLSKTALSGEAMRGGQENTIYNVRGLEAGGKLRYNATINTKGINLPLNNAKLDCMPCLFRLLLFLAA